MALYRTQTPLPPNLSALTDIEAFSIRLASALMPEMRSTWGPILAADNQVVAWDAHGWQSDGAFVVLSVRPGERTIQLYVDTQGLERPSASPSREVNWLLMASVIAAVGAGLWNSSFWVGLTTLVVTIGLWMAKDILLQVRAEGLRKIDTVAWDSRLSAAIRSAGS